MGPQFRRTSVHLPGEGMMIFQLVAGGLCGGACYHLNRPRGRNPGRTQEGWVQPGKAHPPVTYFYQLHYPFSCFHRLPKWHQQFRNMCSNLGFARDIENPNHNRGGTQASAGGGVCPHHLILTSGSPGPRSSSNAGALTSLLSLNTFLSSSFVVFVVPRMSNWTSRGEGEGQV